MSNEKVKLPNPNAIKELKERYYKRKNERLKEYDKLAEVLKKKTPAKKIAKSNNLPDVEL